MGMVQADRVEELIRRCYAAYVAKDREAVEALIAEDFTFTSPLDDHINRTVYLERCWPNSQWISRFDIERLFVSGGEAFVLYRLETAEGKSFRNTEFFKTRGDQVTEVQVYFGATEGKAEGSGRS